MSLEAGGARSLVKRVVRGGLLALVSVGLIYFLVSRAGLTWSALAHSIAGFAGWALLCVLILTGANLGLATLKWLLVIRALAPDTKSHPSFVDAMLTTAFGALLGQMMPFQLGVALARSLAGKIGIGHSGRVNLGTTIYEQLFDAIVLLAAAALSAIALVLRPALVGWIVLVLCSALLVALFASILLPSILAAIALGLAGMPRNRVWKSTLGLLSALEKMAELSPSVLALLTIMSVLRYAAIVVWVVIVLGALQMWTYAIPAVIGMPLITVIGLIPVTPGNLGVTEWTWSAILVSAGATMSSAGLFALTVRIVNVVALLVLIVFLFGVHALQRVPMIWRWREE